MIYPPSVPNSLRNSPQVWALGSQPGVKDGSVSTDHMARPHILS